MANKKQSFMRLETREDFEKLWKQAYNCGYELGFKDGRVDALSILMKMINDDFSIEEQQLASYEGKRKAIARWKDEQKRIKSEIEYGVKKAIEQVAQEASEESSNQVAKETNP